MAGKQRAGNGEGGEPMDRRAQHGHASGHGVAGRSEVYKGHEIFVPDDQRRKHLFIDGRSVGYGTAGGEYYLDVYAYDRAKSLDEVVRRYLDFKDQADARAKKNREA